MVTVCISRFAGVAHANLMPSCYIVDCPVSGVICKDNVRQTDTDTNNYKSQSVCICYEDNMVCIILY